jgi:dephospho-CoA kinase
LIIGLTGGIGSGKSAAGNIFRRHGITVIDADQASREVFERDPEAKSNAIDLLGEEIVQSDGTLSREKIRNLVFNDFDLKSNLEKIIHPAVRKLISNKIQKSESIYTIIEVPLIFETNSAANYQRILVIDCKSEISLNRAASRDNVPETEIKKIMLSQCSRNERLSIANDVITNNDSLEDLEEKISTIHNFYLELFNE